MQAIYYRHLLEWITQGHGRCSYSTQVDRTRWNSQLGPSSKLRFAFVHVQRVKPINCCLYSVKSSNEKTTHLIYRRVHFLTVTFKGRPNKRTTMVRRYCRSSHFVSIPSQSELRHQRVHRIFKTFPLKLIISIEFDTSCWVRPWRFLLPAAVVSFFLEAINQTNKNSP